MATNPSTNGNKSIPKDSTTIEFYFLGLIRGKKQALYEQISSESIKILLDHFGKNPSEEEDQGWTKWSLDSITIDEYTYSFEVSYYKKRLIIKLQGDYKTSNFAKLFKISKDQRDKLEKHSTISSVLKQFSNRETITTIYVYPLVRICRWITPDDIKSLTNKELSTTFFYEILDPFERKAFIFPKKALLRLSRPSVITTEISELTKNKLINAIYDSCLYEKRSRKIRDSIPDDIFEKMRIFIEDIFIKNQASTAQIRQSNYILILSIISGFSAIATTYSLIFKLNPLALSFFGITLLFAILLIIILLNG